MAGGERNSSDEQVRMTSFPAETVERWRTESTFAAETECMREQSVPGWAVAASNPAAALRPFDRLNVNPACDLTAYVHSNGSNRNSIVVALPRGRALPPPPAGGAAPPNPTNALPGFMGAIVGDGSDESYLQASVAARELESFAARGHARGWRLHHVLDDDATAFRELTEVSPEQRRPSGSLSSWTWSGRVPERFTPTVSRSATVVAVTFFTYTALGLEQIVRHHDTFPTDAAETEQYVAERLDELIGSGRSGYAT